ncbi:MAG: LemA family protein [Phycisphaeraceae bacterium]|nr:LemA family protein [Phycisphaeraceae bacterium]MCW5753573.1 LemA family protein [Phycisphaeraceae bacterium]
MPDAWIVVLILAAVFVLMLLWFIGMYNTLVRRRVDADNAWSQIDVQLKRRYDLIPNLVETVKGYATHERETLDAVISARQHAVNITSDAAHAAMKAQAEGALSGALSRLLAVAEAYPNLKADANFRQLQEELTSTENKIGFARQHFNDTVGRYEETRQTFPTNIVAAMFNFKERQYFRLEEAAQREAPKVSFS